MTVPVGADSLMGSRQDDTGAEHNVKKFVVYGDDIAGPCQEGWTNILQVVNGYVSIALDDSLINMGIIAAGCRLSTSRCIQGSIEYKPPADR